MDKEFAKRMIEFLLYDVAFGNDPKEHFISLGRYFSGEKFSAQLREQLTDYECLFL